MKVFNTGYLTREGEWILSNSPNEKSTFKHNSAVNVVLWQCIILHKTDQTKQCRFLLYTV